MILSVDYFNLDSSKGAFLELAMIEKWLSEVWQGLVWSVSQPIIWLELGFVVMAVVCGWASWRFVRRQIRVSESAWVVNSNKYLAFDSRGIGLVVLVAIFAWIGYVVLSGFQVSGEIVYKFAFAANALLIFNVAQRIFRGSLVPKFVAAILFLAVILELLGWYQPVTQLLKEQQFQVVKLTVVPYDLIVILISFTVLLWLANFATGLLSKFLRARKSLTPSTRVLLSNLQRIGIFCFAILIGLNIAGVDLTSLAVFSGALGLGLGFGLQKVISNFFCGLVLLLDRSIKPGDVIEIDDSFGWINSIRSRYVSVITRDRKEHLIPNEDLITNKVINWSFSDKFIRVKADVGISYQADPHRARDICLEAMKSVDRVLEFPEPNCLLMGFGDSSVDLQLRFWINTPKEGVGNIRSAVLFKVWDLFKQEGIEIPFPQRDLHVKSVPEEMLTNYPRRHRQRGAESQD